LAAAARRRAAAGRGRAALAVARRIGMPRLRGATLAALVPQLADDLLEAALVQAGDLKDPWARGVALGALLPRLPAACRPAAITDILAAAHSLDWLPGDVLLCDAARALAASGDSPSARHLLAGVREEPLRRATLAAFALDGSRFTQPAAPALRAD
jgi:hypothetical protein